MHRRSAGCRAAEPTPGGHDPWDGPRGPPYDPGMTDVDVPAGHLYLGEGIDPADRTRNGQAVLVEAADLTTHGVLVGMTGSGKTGLGVVMLEEALLQGIPTLILDPKGDLGNLLLTFPDLAPGDFAPWVEGDKLGVRASEEWEAVAHPLGATVDGGAFTAVDYDDRDLRAEAPPGATYVLGEAPLDDKRWLAAAEKGLVDHLYRERPLQLLRNARLKLASRVGESAEGFATRCRTTAEDVADTAQAALTRKYEAGSPRPATRWRPPATGCRRPSGPGRPGGATRWCGGRGRSSARCSAAAAAPAAWPATSAWRSAPGGAAARRRSGWRRRRTGPRTGGTPSRRWRPS